MRLSVILVISLLPGIAVSGCARKQLAETCSDGWTTDEVGASAVYQPVVDERNQILEAINPASSVTCFHSLARGDILVVFDDRSTATVRKTQDGYKLVERGKIMRVN
jgi:hypothetical protein